MSTKLILVLVSSGSDFSLQMFDGVRVYAQRVGWQVQSAEYQAVGGDFVRMVRAPTTDLEGLVKFWRPDGCIVDFYGGNADWLDRPFEGVPTVYFERYNPNPGLPICVYGDSRSVGEIAARELLHLNFADYAFVPWFDESLWWNRSRCEEFASHVKGLGKNLHVYRHKAGSCKDFVALGRWLADLPRPCGVFGANDEVAETVLRACQGKGIAVPNELAVLGADDSRYICESTTPALSSINRDFRNAGLIAAGLLDEMMANPGMDFSSRGFPSSRVVRRASTRFLPQASPLVVRALEFIRRHACEGIGPRDVVKEMGRSRTPADIAFRKGVGHTILDEIHAVRLECAQELLSKGVAPSVVSDRSGYSSLVDFRRVFKKRLGKTVGDFLRNLEIV